LRSGKGQIYQIVVSDLGKRRAIWFGGEGRTEKNMNPFYAFLGKETLERYEYRNGYVESFP
jgi:transposase